MKPSPLTLHHYQLLEISIKPEEGYSQNEEDIYPDIAGADLTSDVGLGTPEGEDDPCDFSLRLNISLSPKEEGTFPYHVQISIEGFVSVVRELYSDELDRKKFVVANGTSILYGVIRETLLMMTPRFKGGAIMLPTVNFLDIVEQMEAEREETHPAATGS